MILHASYATCSLFLLVLVDVIKYARGVYCFSCLFARKGECIQQTCPTGFFGCFKTTYYYGGEDEGGLLNNADRYSVMEWKGCNIFPVNNNVDGCITQPILGQSARVVTCYCNSDYCNTTTRSTLSTSVVLLVALLNVVLFCFRYR